MTMDEHIDCDRQLNEAEDKIKELEAELKSARAKYDMYKKCAEDKVKSQAERIKKLEAEKENLRQYGSGLENAQNLITVRYRELEAENANWKQRYIEAVNDLKQALKAINS